MARFNTEVLAAAADEEAAANCLFLINLYGAKGFPRPGVLDLLGRDPELPVAPDLRTGIGAASTWMKRVPIHTESARRTRRLRMNDWEEDDIIIYDRLCVVE